MDEGAIAFETLSIVLFALGTGAVVTGALSLAAAEHAGGFWLIGWAAILLPGGFYAGEAGGWNGASMLGMMIDALFAPLMLMGCMALRRGFDTPWWPLFVGSLAGVARVVFAAWDFAVLETLLAVTLAPALFAFAARTMWRAPEGTWFRRTIASFLAVFALIEIVDGVLDAIGGTNSVLYGALAALGLPLAAMQIASRVQALRVGLTSAEAASAAAERRRDVDRAHFHGLFDEVKELVAELDAETRIIFVNARARELFGLEPDEIVGLRAIDFVPAEVRSLAEENWKEQLWRGDSIARSRSRFRSSAPMAATSSWRSTSAGRASTGRRATSSSHGTSRDAGQERQRWRPVCAIWSRASPRAGKSCARRAGGSRTRSASRSWGPSPPASHTRSTIRSVRSRLRPTSRCSRRARPRAPAWREKRWCGSARRRLGPVGS